MAARRNITVADNFFTGENKALIFTVYQEAGIVKNEDDEVVSGTPQDITGWALSWVLKRRASDPDTEAVILPLKTTSAGIALTTPLSGICTVTVDDDDTVALPGDDDPLYWHELKRTDTGFESVLVYGSGVLRQSAHGS